LGKNGINRRRLSHTQSMEKQIKQKRILTKAEKGETMDTELAFAASGENPLAKETDKGKGMFLSPQDAEEYRAYKRRKKVEEIMAAIAKSEASLINGEDPQRVCERAIRLKQAAIKVPPSWLPQAKTYLGGSKVKIDCVIGGNGETLTKVKAYEMRVALRGNAKELTVFIAPSMLSQNRFAEIKKELKKLCRTAKKAVVKVWVNNDYPFAVLSKVARICCEVGVKYFCVPYFTGCEKLRFDLTNGCQIEVSEVETLAEYRKLCESGVGRIVTRNIWEIYSEWIKEADRIKEEGAAVLLPQQPMQQPMQQSAQQPVQQKIEPQEKIVKLEKEEKQEKQALSPQMPLTENKQGNPNVSTQKSPLESTKTTAGKEAMPKEEKYSTGNAAQANATHTRYEGSDLKFL